MPRMFRKGEDGTNGRMQVEISIMDSRGSLKGAVLATESNLQEAEAGDKR